MQAFKKSLIISAALLATTAMWANTAQQDSSANATVQQELSYEDQMLTKLFLNHVRDRNYEWALSIWEEYQQNKNATTYAYLRLSNEAEVNKINQQLEAME